MSTVPKEDEKLRGIVASMLENNEPDAMIKDTVARYKQEAWTSQQALWQKQKNDLAQKNQTKSNTNTDANNTVDIGENYEPEVDNSNKSGGVTKHLDFNQFKNTGNFVGMNQDKVAAERLQEFYKNSGYSFDHDDDGNLTVTSPNKDAEPFKVAMPSGGQNEDVWQTAYDGVTNYIQETSELENNDSSINDVLNESKQYDATDDQSVKNTAIAEEYVNNLLIDDERAPELETYDWKDVLSDTWTVTKDLLNPKHMLETDKEFLERTSANIAQKDIDKQNAYNVSQKEFKFKVQKNLFEKSGGKSAGSYNSNQEWQNSTEFQEFVDTLSQEDLRSGAIEMKKSELDAATKKENLSEAIDDEGVGERIFEDMIGGGDSVIGKMLDLDGMSADQREKLDRANVARKDLDNKINKHVNKQNHHISSMTKVYSEMEKIAGPDWRSSEKLRLQQIDNEFKILQTGKYTTQEEVDAANVGMETLKLEYEGISKLFEQDKSRYDNLKSTFDEHKNSYNEVMEESKGLITTDKELTAYLDTLGRRHGGIQQASSALQVATSGLVGGLLDGVNALAFAPLRYAEEKYSNGDIPDGFAPIMQIAQKYEKLNDTYGSGAIADHLSNVSKKISSTTQVPVTLDDINFTTQDGLESLGSWMTHTTMTQLPNAAMMYATGGASLYLMSGSSFGNTMRSMDEEMEMYANLPENHPMKDFKYGFANQYSTAIITGAAEGLSEKISLGFVDDLFKNLGSKSAIKDGFRKYVMKEYFSVAGLSKNIYQASLEGGTEAISAITGNLAMRYMSGDPTKSNMNVWEGVPESFISGAYMQGVVFKAPILAQSMLGPFQSTASTDALQANASDILKLEKELNNPSLTTEARESMEQQLRDKVENTTTILKNDIDNIDKMSDPEKAELVRIATENAKLENQLKAIKNDQEIDPKVKEELIKQITGQISKNANNRNLIVAPYNKERNTKLLDKSVKKIRAKAKRMFPNLKITDTDAGTAEQLFEDYRNQQIAKLDNEMTQVESDYNDGNITQQQYESQKADIEMDLSEAQNINESDAKYANGFILENGDPNVPDEIVINRDTALEKGAVNVASHEFLHKVLQNTVKDNPQVAKILGQSLMGELAKIDLEGLQKSAYRTRLEQYRNAPESMQAEEVLTTFADAVQRGDLKMNSTKVGDVVRRSLQTLGMDIKFNNAKDVYNFIGDYQAYANSNMSMNLGMERAGQKGFKIGGKLQTQVENAQAEAVKAEKEAKKTKQSIDGAFENTIQDMIENPEYGEDANAFMIAEMYNPLDGLGKVLPAELLTIGARSILNKLKTYQDLPQFDQKRKEIVDDILNDPSTNRSIRSIIKSYDVDNTDGPNGERVPLSGYVGSVLSKRGISESVNKHIKSGEGFNSGEGVVDNIGVEDSAYESEQRTTMIDALDNDGNPIVSLQSQSEVIEAMMPIIGVKLPALDAATSKNKAVSPLIALLKKEFGVKNGPIHKAVLNMLGKTPTEIAEFLSNEDMKRVILAVLPTSWLSKNIPNAVEKLVIQENGTKKWTTDHVGRSKGTQPGQVDFWRSTEDGPYKGMTDGKQKIRRNANAVQDVNFGDIFLDGPTVTDIKRGDKSQGKLGLDAMAMAMAQELGMESFDKDLENNGPLTELFEGRQPLFNRVLAENYKSDIIAQMERGTVKMSIDGVAPNLNSEDRIVDLYTQFVNQYDTKKGRQSNLTNMMNILDPEATKFMMASGLFNFLNSNSEQKFVKPLTQFLQNTDSWLLDSFVNDSAEISRAKKAKAYISIINQLPPSLVKKLGKGFFGVTGTSERYGGLGAIKPTSKNYTQFAVDVNDAYLKRIAEVDDSGLDWIDDVHVYNTDGGIIRNISDKILSEHKPGKEGRDSKIDRIENEYGDEIQRANIANPKAMAYLLEQTVAAALKFPPGVDRNNIIYGAIKMLQEATSNTLGTRGLITYDALEVHGASMAVYKYRGKYTNGATIKNKAALLADGSLEINTEHPYYKDAFNSHPNDLVKQADVIKQKLEHQDVSANVNRENAKSILNHFELLQNDVYSSLQADILENLNNEILYNTFQFAGVSNVKLNSDIQDKALTSTSPDAFGRLLLTSLAKGVSVMVPTNSFAKNGLSDLISERINKSVKMLAPTPVKVVMDNKLRDKATVLGRTTKFSKDSKGITVLDFDDTLATSNSLILYTKADGTTGTLTPSQYAKDYQSMLGEGTVFDFSQFNEVIDGKTAPLFQKAMKLQGKFGPANMFVLTARPAESAPAIFAFLQANGLNIPLQNITGLANSTAEAKALWIASKVVDGYNDFYFADDAIQNVEAVDNILEQFDVKRKVQQAKVNFSKDADTVFNDILEESSGVESEKVFSRAKASQRGKGKGVWQLFIPASAEDFKGLLYKLLSKGKLGEKQMKWLQENLIDPFARGIRELDGYTRNLTNEYQALLKANPQVRKALGNMLGNTEFTLDQGIRVYLWNKAGIEVPGLSKSDLAEIIKAVESNPQAVKFANDLNAISKKGYSTPSDYWMTESIKSDLTEMIDDLRADFLAEWIEKKNEVFSEKNMNKLEAIHGPKYVEALRDILYRMENGTNRSFGSNRLVNGFANWINNSVGAIMFFNMRSAVLQTLSTVNFLNWEENNLMAAAKAFANQKQYWSDFLTLWNSDMLVQRRSGLRTGVSQQELSAAVKGAKNPVKAVFQYLLKLGFTPTQIADSFAIASGGATFYRNRLEMYKKQGMDQKQAEDSAFNDFQNIAEETQQSSRPDMISQQQASVLGRFILAFQNTPMQYARLTKKALLDLIAGRGSVKANVSRIIYYGAVQNLIFASLQKALFAFAFDDDDEEDKKKQRTKETSLLNGMLDSFLRGMGIGGAIVATSKNMIIKFLQEEKKDFRGDDAKVLIEMLNLSPTVGSKIRKMHTALKTWKFKKEVIKEMDVFDIDNPIWQAIGNVISSTTNVPLDRAVQKVINIKQALNEENQTWQRIALILGWNTWDLDVKQQDIENAKEKIKIRKDIQKKNKQKTRNEEDKKKREKERKEKDARSVQCASLTDKGKGRRCRNKTENKSGKCYAHQ